MAREPSGDIMINSLSKMWNRFFLMKRLNYTNHDHPTNLERNLNLFDLIAIGVGGTVGSGVFVLNGIIAKDYAGPGVITSFLLAGISTMFSAASYAELSSRIPAAGSAYTYAYVTLGEYIAVIGAWSLSLEYGISGAAVARSWGDKVFSLGGSRLQNVKFFNPGFGVNLFAGLIQVICVLVLLAGLDIGKITVNFFTVLKVFLIVFMIVTGLSLFKSSNLIPFAPMGVRGVFSGSASCFFAYIGYDEVCCMASESKNPNRDLPVGVFVTILVVTFLNCLAALALVGMQSYASIDSAACFSSAFASRGFSWASHIVSVGEIVSLPLVVLVSFLAQPRLQFAMAKDGLLPSLFAETDAHGNLKKGILVSGLVCTLVATFVPFTYMNDMISAGILVSFQITNSALIVVRRDTSVCPAASALSGAAPGPDRASSSSPCSSSSRTGATSYSALASDIKVEGGYVTPAATAYQSPASATTDSPLLFSAYPMSPCKRYLLYFHISVLTVAVLISCAPLDNAAVIVSCIVCSCVAVLFACNLLRNCPENSDAAAAARTQYRVPHLSLPFIGIALNSLMLAQLSLSGVCLLALYYVFATLCYIINHMCFDLLAVDRESSDLDSSDDDFGQSNNSGEKEAVSRGPRVVARLDNDSRGDRFKLVGGSFQTDNEIHMKR